MTDATTIPVSTYRLHLTHAFTLDDAAQMVDYLADLGIDWAYASPIQTVPEGATHGYHILDPDTVNPELGGPAGLQALHAALEDHGMGLVLDIVPNHMASSVENPWWADVLARGADSPHAATFDIDFDAGPIVLPILGQPLETEIAQGTISVDGGALAYHDVRLPLSPDTDQSAPLGEVLAAQNYRLHEWRSGERVLNWRRFFAVNELAGLRVEDDSVFDAVHAAILGWVDDGIVQGLRVDHIDGLREPGAYLRTLRSRLGLGRWLVVEKILEQGEAMPEEWPVEGTTGYEVNTMLQAWATDRAGHQRLRQAFADLTDLPMDTVSALPASKLAAIDELFPAEVARVVDQLEADQPAILDVLPDDREPLDRQDITDGIRHLTAHLGAYRTYATPDGPLRPADQDLIERAAAAATAAGHDQAASVAGMLGAKPGRPALLRWQQLTGPAAAKGFEDSLLFRQVAMPALCEVGADAHFLDELPTDDHVTGFLTDRAALTPTAGTTTSTHDTKRSEDVRARLTVLAEAPQDVAALVTTVRQTLDAAVDPIDAHGAWLAVHTLVATLGLAPGTSADQPPGSELSARIHDHMAKAVREAGIHTSHRDPDTGYEHRVTAWLDALMADGSALRAVQRLVGRIAVPAACVSLGTVLLKIAGPGIPDIYRGCEVPDDSLTDPDNRRPLDVAALRSTLAGVDADPTEVRDRWTDGVLKMLVTTRALHARRDNPAVFASTICSTPARSGAKADHVMALTRQASDRGPFGVADPAAQPTFLAAATRLPLALAAGEWPIGEVWGDTTIDVGSATSAHDVLTDRQVAVHGGQVTMADAAAILPVALLRLT